MDIIDSKDIPEDQTKVKEKPRIIEIDYSIAFKTGNNKIYINKNLKDYNKELYNKIIGHELKHDKGGYTTNDLREDLSVDFMSLREKIKFCMKYPKGLWAFSPIIVTKDEIAISWLGVAELLIFLGILIFIICWVILKL